MLSERYRPKAWTDFVGQPIIAEIEQACGDEWLFDGCGERWLFESDGIAGCGKTSAAYVTARALGCSDFAIERIDSRASTVADLRQLASSMHTYGWGRQACRMALVEYNRRARSPHSGLLKGVGDLEWVRAYEVDADVHRVVKAGTELEAGS